MKSCIFTVPYVIDTTYMYLKYDRHANRLIDNSKTFYNITELHSKGEDVMDIKWLLFSKYHIIISSIFTSAH